MGKMLPMKNVRCRMTMGVLLTCWLVVSLAALVGMYHLWWQRERVVYLGKDVLQQREIVFQRAGFFPSFVEKTELLKQQWSPSVRYTAKGDLTTSFSYIKYLLIPRIPSGKENHTLTITADAWSVVGGEERPVSEKYFAQSNTKSPVGFFLSLFFIAGVGCLLRMVFGNSLHWPEALGLACFFLLLVVLSVRFFSHSAQLAFLSVLLAGLAGWVGLLFSYFQKRYRLGSQDKGRTSCRFLYLQNILMKEKVVTGVFIAVIVLAVFWSLIMAVIVVPDDWDSWAIWGGKAKVLALGTGPLHDVTWFGHADYPLLWPAVWAFSGWLSGGWEEYWSRGWGMVFLVLCVWEIVCIVNHRSKSLSAGFFAGALLVSIPNVPLITSWGYAEAPLWLMMTCGLGTFLRWSDTEKIRDVILTALFAAAAAYTKNEGILFALLLGSLVAVTAHGRIQPFLYYCLIVVLFYSPWLYWSRIYLDLGSHATGGLHLGTETLQRAWQRFPSAFDAIRHMWLDIKQWNIVGAGIAFSLLGLPLLWRHDKQMTLSLALPLGLLVGYLVIILFHPAEIYWQIGTAWNRLTVQTIPLFLVLLVSMYWRFFKEKICD